jgi:hypothetical protein
MGITFRDSSYVTHVCIGKRTIKAGEAAAVWDSYGNHTLCIGPMLKRLFFSDIRFLDGYTARDGEYLIVEYTDGKKEHVVGPVKIWMDPLKHQSITVAEAIFLAGPAELIVVNSPGNQAGHDNDSPSNMGSIEMSSTSAKVMQRRIVRGPISYFPAVNEKIHTFNWSEPFKQFDELMTKQTWDCNVKVPFSDNSDIFLYLTISWTISDPLNLIDLTANPIKCLTAALSQDMAKYGAKNTSESLKDISQVIYDGRLPIDTFKSEAGKLGISIDSIVLRNVEVGKVLADKFKAQEKFTVKLAEESASAEQMNKLAGSDIKARKARASAERELEASNQSHKLKLAEEAHQVEVRRKQEFDEANLKYLKELSNLGVDMTKYMCAKVQGSSLTEEENKDKK